MKAVVCREFGPPETLRVEDVESPEPGPGQIRIRVRAAGLNFPDTLMVAGTYQLKPPFPFTPGMEAAGVVDAAGEGSAFNAGDRVLAMTGTGAFAEEAVVGDAQAMRIPDTMSFDEAAAFPVTYGTTLHALRDRGRLRQGEALLVFGAAGGVGLNAVEIGKILGANVIACASSEAKLAVARAYGADHGIDYSTESIKDRVKEITGGAGADVVYDPVGGDAFDQALRCIAWDGRLLVIGFASGTIPKAPANLVLLKQCSVVGVFWGAWAQREPDANRRNFEEMLEWYRQGKIRPHVSATFGLERVPDAMQSLLSRRTTGKVVITTDTPSAR
jgi:NADPH:quinone reductase